MNIRERRGNAVVRPKAGVSLTVLRSMLLLLRRVPLCNVRLRSSLCGAP